VKRTVEIVEEPVTAVADYARVPIAFTVDRVVDVTEDVDRPVRFTFSERRLDVPYEKDYDAIEGAGPLLWPRRFDLSNWALFAARVAARRVGGAAVAFDTPALTVPAGRRDVAVLWDIRVHPDARGQGVGTALFATVEAWAQRRGCRHLEIETQNINVPACRFYERQGCQLRALDRAAYPDFPDEIQLLWYKDLAQ
jgi:GNAT superfamily N-acetyltransferase